MRDHGIHGIRCHERAPRPVEVVEVVLVADQRRVEVPRASNVGSVMRRDAAYSSSTLAVPR
jgi:hypothetical protein